MHPGPWRNPDRDNDLHTSLKLVNSLLALANVAMLGWLMYAAGTWLYRLFT
jgi:hypothetical protein